MKLLQPVKPTNQKTVAFAAMVLLIFSLGISSIVHAEKGTGFESFLPLVESLANNPLVVNAVVKQNKEDLTLETIKARDETWVKTDGATELKQSLLTNEVGQLFHRLLSENVSFSEIFLTDNKGANVAAVPTTTDYWQGDEKKWSDSYAKGQGKVVISPFQYDKSANTVAAQISMPVSNDETVIGVLIVGIKIKSYVQELAK